MTAPRNTAPTNRRAGGEQVRTAGELRGREQTGEAEQRCDEVEDGRELGSTLAGFRSVVATDHRRHPRAPFGLDLLPAAHARAAPNNGDEQRDTGQRRCDDAVGTAAEVWSFEMNNASAPIASTPKTMRISQP